MNELKQSFHIANKDFSLYRFSLPFNKPISFKNNLLPVREGLWLVEHHPDGAYSIGEISPLPGFSQETLSQCEEQLLTLLQMSQQPNCKYYQQGFPTTSLLPSTCFALFCLQERTPWIPPCDGLNDLQSVPLLQGNLREVSHRYQQLQCPSLIKLKVARIAIQDDLKVLHHLITINPKIRFRLDANQQWTNKQYIAFLTQISSKYIDYIEEPTASLNENLSISKQFNVSIGLDESLLTHTALPAHHCIKALIIKPTLIGFPSRINALLTHAKTQQLSVSISASFESPIALEQLNYLAKQWQQQTNLSITLGLDTLYAFQDDMVKINLSSTEFQKKLLTQATCLWRSQ